MIMKKEWVNEAVAKIDAYGMFKPGYLPSKYSELKVNNSHLNSKNTTSRSHLLWNTLNKYDIQVIIKPTFYRIKEHAEGVHKVVYQLDPLDVQKDIIDVSYLSLNNILEQISLVMDVYKDGFMFAVGYLDENHKKKLIHFTYKVNPLPVDFHVVEL